MPNYKGVSISSSTFSGCNAIKSIKVSNFNIDIPENEVFGQLVCNSDILYVTTHNKENKNKCSLYFLENDKLQKISDLPKSLIQEHAVVIKLTFWDKIKKSSAYKSVQNAKLPASYIIEALGKNEELINAYYQTRNNGVSILENQFWFQSLTDKNKVHMIRLFAHLGGFEDNANYQKRVIAFMNAHNRNLIGHFNNLSSSLTLTEHTIIEYERDKNNKIIIENGFPKIKSEKKVRCHKKILEILESNFSNKNFIKYAEKVVLGYPKLYQTYRKTLANLNPDRNANSSKEIYENFKQKGINFDFIKGIFGSTDFYVENSELKSVIYDLNQYSQKQNIISTYDEYLSEAKDITLNAMAQNKRVKVFSDNVVDDSSNALKYVWTPITSPVALTIGDRFDTCYRVEGMNEAGLLAVISSPIDWLFLVYDESNNPIAYCRVSYDEEKKGILIDNIELDKNMMFDDNRKLQIWSACERALKDMKIAMNNEGQFIVERIHCKHDSFNKIFPVIKNLYPNIMDIDAQKLKNRVYTTDKEIDNKSYQSTSYGQIQIDGPEMQQIAER